MTQKALNRGKVNEFDPIFYRDAEDNRQDAETRIRTLEKGDAVNVALAIHGATSSATSTDSATSLPEFAANGDRTGENFGSYNGWFSSGSVPQTYTRTFVVPAFISRIDLFMLQDDPPYVVPTRDTLGSLKIMVDFDVYIITPLGASVLIESVTGNDRVWRRFDFDPAPAQGVEIVCNSSADTIAYLVELEAWSAPYNFQRP